MIYSFGRTDRHDALPIPHEIVKAGRGSPRGGRNYPGAIVMRTKAEAATISAKWTARDGLERLVVGIDADWTMDTYQRPGELLFRRLTRDAKIILLDD